MATKVAVIGCGRRGAGFARACKGAGDIEYVGFADPVEGAAAKMQEEFGGTAFTDTAEMLAKTKPEFVCLVTRPNVRVEPITQCAEAGVKAVLSEKPMSHTWAAAVAQRAVAEKTGMLTSYCHQRRTFGSAETTKKLMASGAIGDVQRLEAYCSNLYDWGTHWFDMCEFLVGDVDAEWVLAQADRKGVRTVFDQPVDRAGVSVVRYSNGHTAVLMTGDATIKGAGVRVVGSEGELRLQSDAKENAVTMINKDGVTHPEYENRRGIECAVQHCLACMREGRPSLLDSQNAIRATEQIYASYWSSQRGERVPLPLAREGLELPLSEFFTVA